MPIGSYRVAFKEFSWGFIERISTYIVKNSILVKGLRKIGNTYNIRKTKEGKNERI